MAKQEQVLILEPASELHFVGPFTDVVTSYLKLSNPLSDRRVCFKVKTTAPKKYCVRPNGGILEPNQVISVAVMLQPFDYNPTEKNKHKFMVQTMIVPDGDINQDNLWRDAKPDSLMDSKLKCVFDMPLVQNNNLDTNAVTEEKSEFSKSSGDPLVKSQPKASNVDSDLKKIAEENKRLKDEIQFMKQENSQLKAEGLRLRTRGTEGPPKPPTFDERTQDQPQSPMLYLAVFLTIGLLGIFIGKFIV